MPDHSSSPRLTYSIRETADLLGVSTRTIYRATWAGEIQTTRLRGKVLIPATELDRLLLGLSPKKK